MKKLDSRQRLEIGAYIVITALALPSYVVALQVEDSSLRDLLINLSATFAGSGLLFFLLNRFFGLGSDNNEKLEEILRKHHLGAGNFIMSIDDIRREYPLQDIINRSKQIDLLGQNLSNILNHHRKSIIECVRNGANIRVIIMQSSVHVQNTTQQSSQNQILETSINSGLAYVENIREALANSQSPKGTFEVRLISWIPSCTMIIADAKMQTGVATITINGANYDNSVSERPHFALNKQSQQHWFNYFAEEFDYTWKIGTILPEGNLKRNS